MDASIFDQALMALADDLFEDAMADGLESGAIGFNAEDQTMELRDPSIFAAFAAVQKLLDERGYWNPGYPQFGG